MWKKESVQSGIRSHYLSRRSRVSCALGHQDISYGGSKMKIFKHQTDEKEGPKSGTHFSVPLFGPTFCGDLVKIGRE